MVSASDPCAREVGQRVGGWCRRGVVRGKSNGAGGKAEVKAVGSDRNARAVPPSLPPFRFRQSPRSPHSHHLQELMMEKKTLE